MNAEQVVAPRFGIASALPSTPERCITAVLEFLGEGLVWALAIPQ